MDRAAALIDTLARTLAREPRAEAARTAAVLRARGAACLDASQAPGAWNLRIRTLLAGSRHPAARAVLVGFDLIPWGPNPVATKAGNSAAIYLVAPLMGPEGPVPCADLRMGLFYQLPGSYYGLHSHNAAETYTILAGGAVWTAGTETRHRCAGDRIHHPPNLPHAFEAGPDGLLALWRWSGDIDPASYALLDDPRQPVVAEAV